MIVGEKINSTKQYDNLFGWGKDEPTDEELNDMSLEELMELDVEPTPTTTNTSTQTSSGSTSGGSSFDWAGAGNLLGSFAESSNIFGTKETQQQQGGVQYVQAPKSNNTGLYIALALFGVIAIVVTIVLVSKKK